MRWNDSISRFVILPLERTLVWQMQEGGLVLSLWSSPVNCQLGLNVVILEKSEKTLVECCLYVCLSICFTALFCEWFTGFVSICSYSANVNEDWKQNIQFFQKSFFWLVYERVLHRTTDQLLGFPFLYIAWKHTGKYTPINLNPWNCWNNFNKIR